jgi:O-succinylbenzoic acid--CoA ligase
MLIRSLVAGTSPMLVARIDAATLAAGAEAGCDYVSLVPAQLRRLLDDRAPVGAFRRILLGGAAIPAGMLQEAAAAGASVVTSYGMTETCGGCVYDGLPLDGVSVATAPDGRIRIGGPVLFSGYRLAPEATAAVLRDGWFTTSDLGGFGAGGRLTIRGRADDVINSGGEKVVAAQVEEALRSCHLVSDAVVVGVPDPLWGERVTALIIPADPARPPTLEWLRDQVSATLPRYAAPRDLRLISEIPMLASGKPDRRLLRELISPGPATTV